MSRTPLYEQVTSARVGEFAGVETAASFSGVEQELTALRSGCAVYDLGWRTKIILTGGDRLKWLNGMVTNNIAALPVDRGNYNYLLNAQGRILGDLWVWNRGEYLLADTDFSQREEMMKTLDHFIIMDDVEMTDASAQLAAMAVEGPAATATLAKLGIYANALEPNAVRDLVVDTVGISLARVRPHEKAAERFEIWASPENLPKLWTALLAAGAVPVGTEALEIWRVLHGIPRYGVDIRQKDLPQETAQEHALNFSKGCYIGQEIVERIRSRGAVHRKFVGFQFEGELPPVGATMERNMGEVTSVARVPTGEGGRLIGLGYARHELGGPGAAVSVGGVNATLAALPFEI